MKRKTFTSILAAGCLLAASLATRPAVSADKVPGDRLLPPNVHAYVTFPSIDELKARWAKSRLGGLRDDPDLAAFWKEIDEQIELVSDEIEKELGVKLDDLLSIPSGEISFAVVQPPGKSIGFVGWLDFGESGETVETLLEKVAEALDDQGAKRSTEEFEDTKLIVYRIGGGDADDEDSDDKPKFCYFLKDSYFVAASDPAILKSVLARWDGKHSKTFADNETYTYILDRSKNEGGTPLMTWYVDPVTLITQAVRSSGRGGLQVNMVLGMFPALGITKLKAAGGSMDIAVGDYDSISRTVMYVEQPASGVLNMFRFPEREQTPPKWVSAAATTYMSLNWDIPGAVKEVKTLVDMFLGAGRFDAALDQAANGANGPQIHPQEDFIDHLGGRIQVVVEAAESDDDDQQRIVVALSVKDADKINATLAKIAKTAGFPGESRQFRGTTLYELDTTAVTGGMSGLAVANGNLMFASDITLLEQIIRGGNDRASLADSAKYRKLADKFPAKTSIVGFQQQDAQIKTAYEALRSGQIPVDFDLSKLPPFKALEKYLAPTASYAVPDRNGVLFVSFSLKKEDK